MILELLLIMAVILVLYARTYKYNNLVDDFVPRSGVLLVLGEKPPSHTFYDQRRPLMATITNVGVFMAVCGYIYLLWGFWPAMLFTVMPTNVCGVAWTTGNYYMSTVLLTLASYYALVKWGLVGLGLSHAFYVAALGSTVNAIPFAFVAIALCQDIESITLCLPLLAFLFGKRFQTGLKLRADKHKELKIDSWRFNWRQIFVMTKVVGYYIALNLWPSRLGFFHEYPKYAHSNRADRLFWLNLVLILAFAWLGWTYHWQGMVWWFLFIGVFSQFTTFGQFVAERYMVLANVGFCLVICVYMAQFDTILILLTVSWFWSSWSYIRAYKSNLSLFSHSISAFPYTPENYTNLASHYLERKQKEKAIEPLLCALRFVTVNSWSIHANLAACYAGVGYFQKALYHIQESLKHAPESKKEGLQVQEKDLKSRIEKIEQNQRTLKKYGII